MKNYVLTSMKFLCFLFLCSCESQDHVSELGRLSNDLTSIEMTVSAFDFKVLDVPDETIINKDYFTELERVRLSIDQKERESTLLRLSASESKSSNRNSDQFLSMIINSYANMISGKSYIEILYIADIYICELHELTLTDESRKLAIESITFYRDLKVYVNSWKESSDAIMHLRKDSDAYKCRFHPCVECCFIEELEAIEENAVKLVLFLFNIGFNTAALGLACIYACVV
ncbi:MAG: hypothetical protein LC649_02270 [Bacteroidales bacterium]|nr:hypothetical protein [Bacteroidales bacterium]